MNKPVSFELEAESYRNAFINKKEAEKQKLEFAINSLKEIQQPNGDLLGNKIKLKIEELEQKLSKLTKTKDHEI